MADSGLRLILILQKIPRFPRKITTQELADYLTAEGYDVAIRTIQRDLSILSGKFNIIQTPAEGRGKNGVGWAFAEMAVSSGIPSMDPQAALTVLMGIDHLNQLLPLHVQQHLHPLREEAGRILAAFDRKPYTQWLDKVRMIPGHVLLPPEINPEALEVIYQALLENRRFQASYKGKPNQTISPYGLVHRDGTFYLLCKFSDFPDIRIAALHRFGNAQLLTAKVKPDPDFNIDDYLKSGQMDWHWGKTGKNPIYLNLLVSEPLAGHLQESPLSHDQTLSASDTEGWQQLSATVQDSHQLRYWLASQGDNLQVIAPKKMRNWFAAAARHLYQFYPEEN
jgi:predicted DNA-binding transcriptional regulator YafY